MNLHSQSIGLRLTGPARKLLVRGRVYLQFATALALQWVSLARGENQVDYRYEYYGEEGNRIEVNTHAVFFEFGLLESLSAKGELIYDGISGASPKGLPPPPGSNQVPLLPLSDIRRAASLELDANVGRQTLSPRVAYSGESDYISVGVSLNDAIEFNQKNTTLRLGAAHSFDSVLDSSSPRSWRAKDSTDLLLGVSQLLGPKTIFTADFTYGLASGYLTDPYKLVLFTGWMDPNAGYPENRPDNRNRQVLLLTLTQFFDKLDASAEFSYRFHHDSFGIFSHTAGLTWYQKVGSHLIIAPSFRFYQQAEADFYTLGVPGFFPNDGNPNRPKYYSSDYRLSHMRTFTYGVQLTAPVTDWLQFDAGYQRYEMCGLDGVTSGSAYPKANIFNVGLRLWF